MSNITLKSLMTPGSIFFLDESFGKKEAIAFLSEKIKKEVPRDVAGEELEKIFQESGDTQQLHASGLYLAFAKFPELRDIHSVLGIHRQGFYNGGANTVKAVLLTLVPRRPEFFQKHLDFLSAVNYVFTEKFISGLAMLKDSQAVYDTLSK